MGKRGTKKAERALPGRRELLAAVDSLNVAVVATSPEGEITSWNEAAERIFGYRPDEVLGRPVSVLVPPGDLEAADAVLARARKGEPVYDIGSRQLHKDGGLVIVNLSVSPVIRGKAVIGLVFSARDVAAQRQAEKALLKKAGELQGLVESIVESSDEAIVGLDPDLVVMSWNTGAERLYGYPAGEAVGQPVGFLLPTAGIDPKQGVLGRVADGDRVSGYETQVRTRDGSVIPVSLSASPILDPSGTVVGISSIAHDITDRRQIQEALAAARDEALEASRLKSQFLATMSHEIRTPMNGVIGLTGLLLDSTLDALQQQYADGIRSAGEALLSIINDILDFSKIEAGKLELETVDFDLAQLVEEVAELVAEPARHKGVEVLASCDPELPDGLSGDANRIRQVLLNLASNAVKFTAQGEVFVGARRHDGSDRLVVRFEVTDTGIGIDDEHRDRLFEPFSQADASTTRRFGGTGLGLAISRQLVEAMGGEIGLASEVGQGSTFWFTVPLEPRLEVSGSQRVTDALTGLRALVVDDNQTNRLILYQQLNAWGLRPEAVPDGPAGLERLREAAATGERFGLGVLDLHMPDMDGLELAGHIAGDPALAGTPLILLTSGGDVDAEVARRLGIVARLTKPVRQSYLYNCLLRIVSGTVEAAVRPAPRIIPRAEAGQRAILVVEDNEINQMVALGILAKLGYGADVAVNGLRAVEATSGRRYAAILMDCHMPEMDGYQATAAIRAREGSERHTPIIAMTAGVLTEDRERALAAGMDDYVTKPVDAAALEAVLLRWLGQDRGPDVIVERRKPAPLELLNHDRLAVLRGLGPSDGRGLLPRLVDAFVAEAPAAMASLRAAAAAGGAALSQSAHRLKGAAANLGATRLAAVCGDLETAGRATGETGETDVGALLHRLESDLTATCAALAETVTASGEVAP
ncbi:MAG: PAS domain S-box protein [Acidimicrobiia bacterium]